MKLLIASVLLALALPAAAQADSIVYIDGGNVWSAHPDGSGKVQLTTGGGWHSPTQADDGTIAAVQGTGPITVWPPGRTPHTITTPPARSADGGTFAPRPVELSLSPDGKTLAYVYAAYSCPPASSCGAIERSTFYTRTDVTDATPVDVYGNQFGVSDPEWVTNSRTLVFGGFGSQVSIDDLGPGDYSQKPWMVPNGDMGDGEVTRDGKRLAVTWDYGANKQLAFFAVKGDVKTELPPAYPDAACSTTSGDAAFADPSWSPDGSQIAFQSADGLEIMRFTAFGADECAIADDHVLSATGSEPDWGPADPPAAPAPPPAPAPSSPAPAPKPVVRLAIGALHGRTVTVTVPGPGRATLTATLKGRKVASGKATAKQAGTLTIKLSKKLPKHKKLTLKLTFSHASVTKTI